MTLIARPLAVLMMLVLALGMALALAAPASAAAAPPEVPDPCIPGASPPIWDGAPDFSCYS